MFCLYLLLGGAMVAFYVSVYLYVSISISLSLSLCLPGFWGLLGSIFLFLSSCSLFFFFFFFFFFLVLSSSWFLGAVGGVLHVLGAWGFSWVLGAFGFHLLGPFLLHLVLLLSPHLLLPEETRKERDKTQNKTPGLVSFLSPHRLLSEETRKEQEEPPNPRKTTQASKTKRKGTRRNMTGTRRSPNPGKTTQAPQTRRKGTRRTNK